jgi:Amt family ammonium transporter
MFAIITPGLIVGAVAERDGKFSAYILFIVLFSLLVSPLAHWTWHPQVFFLKWVFSILQVAPVVHISAGCTCRKTLGFKRDSHISQKEIPPAIFLMY